MNARERESAFEAWIRGAQATTSPIEHGRMMRDNCRLFLDAAPSILESAIWVRRLAEAIGIPVAELKCVLHLELEEAQERRRASENEAFQ